MVLGVRFSPYAIAETVNLMTALKNELIYKYAFKQVNPRGSIYTTIMELGLQNHDGDALLGPNSIIVVYIDPLGMLRLMGKILHYPL